MGTSSWQRFPPKRRMAALPERLGPSTPSEELASAIGNRAFARLVETPGTLLHRAPQAPAPTPTDLTAEAGKLLKESPKNDVEYASWLLRASDQGFAELWSSTRKQLEDFRDDIKTDKGVLPSAAEVDAQGLVTMYSLIRASVTAWLAKPSEAKKPLVLGSFIRDRKGPHSGAGIDLPRAMGEGTAAEVIDTLSALPKADYGIGFPFSGDYFNPADEIEAKKAAARMGTSPSAVTGALQKFASHVYKVEWDPQAKAWKKAEIEQHAAAYTKLVSQPLKDKLDEMRKAGFGLTIFPDNPNHLHVDRR
jgi:hypothetical protein